MKRLLRTVGVVALAAAGLTVAFVFVMRTKSPRAQKLIRSMNRAVANPKQMKTAGSAGAYASIVRHVGRTSGRPYETPVVAVRIDGTLAVALPYGMKADWLRNVLEHGSATIVHEGNVYDVDTPEIVPIADVDHAFDSKDRRSHRLFGTDQALRVRVVGDH